MTGVTSIEVQESLEDLAQRLRQATQLIIKERLQVLYGLKKKIHPGSVQLPKQSEGIEAPCNSKLCRK
jgi:hypothetical protein